MEFVKKHDKTAIIYDDINVSYEKLIRFSKYYSTLLKLKKEEKVMIFSPNRPELVYSFLGTWEQGGTCVNIDYSNNVEELLYVLKDSKPEYIFTVRESEEKLEEAIKLYGGNIKVFYYDDIIVPEDFVVEDERINSPNPENIALMLYTSGTTGDPKGVMISFDNIMSQVEALSKFEVFKKEDVFLALLPLHHIFPLLGSAIVPLYFGSTIVFLKEMSSDKILEALKKYKITMLLGVPRLYEVFHRGIMSKIEASKIAKFIFNIAKKIENQSFRKKLFKKVQEGFGGNIRFLVSGGAKLDLEISKNFRTLGFDLLEGYGLTETSPMISFTRPNHIRPGSCGFLLEDIDVKLSDENELLVKGRNVFKGYLNKEEKYKQEFTEDGYFMTGDLAELDDEGYLYITGRKKEMIVLSNGKNINPSSIENEILNLADDLIEELAVVDHDNMLKTIIYPNFKKLEELKVSNIFETIKWNIIDKYNSNAPKYKKILNIKIVREELPKTKLGKLRRFKLKEFFNSNEEIKRDIKEPSTESYAILKKYLEDTTKKRIYPDNHIELDLALDSLDLVELQAFLDSSFGIKLNEQEFSNNATVEKLADFLENNSKSMSFKELNWSEILKEEEFFNLPKSSIGASIIRWILMPIFKIYFRLFPQNISEIPKGPVIFAGNHQSFLDGLMLMTGLPHNKLKATYYMAKVKHFKNNIMKKIANNSNIILVDINENLVTTLKESAHILRTGKNLVIFPEGIRSRDGNLSEFKKSFAILSKELNVPIVPFGISGSYEAMPINSKLPRPRKLKLKFFKAIYPENKSVEEIIEETKEAISKWLKD
jgi:long-chain acyl-CoA synthetase